MIRRPAGGLPALLATAALTVGCRTPPPQSPEPLQPPGNKPMTGEGGSPSADPAPSATPVVPVDPSEPEKPLPGPAAPAPPPGAPIDRAQPQPPPPQ
jgi:hypothetical protein